LFTLFSLRLPPAVTPTEVDLELFVLLRLETVRVFVFRVGRFA